MRVAYGPHPDQVGDVVLPKGPAAPAPLVMLLHGGFWRAAYDRHHLAGVAKALARTGYAVVNAEYRRVGAGGGWPTTFEDVGLAVDTLPLLIEQQLPGRVDLDRVVVLGHSAGGHLALWASLRGRLAGDAPGARGTAPRIAGVVALAPACDLAETHRSNNGDGAVAALLGGTPADVPERYAATDPAVLGGPPVPTVVVHGENDVVLPEAMSRAWCTATGTRLVTVPGTGHFELIDPRSAAWPHVLDSVSAVVARGPGA